MGMKISKYQIGYWWSVEGGVSMSSSSNDIIESVNQRKRSECNTGITTQTHSVFLPRINNLEYFIKANNHGS